MRAASIAVALAICLAADESAVLAGSVGPSATGSSKAMPALPREPETGPVELKVEVESFDPNRLLLTVRRTGYLVALRAGGRASAAVDSVSAEIANAPADSLELTWETTRQSTLETERGGLHVTSGDGHPSVSSHALPSPVVVATQQDHLHRCQAYEGGHDAFTVICRVANGAAKIAAVNVTEPAPFSDVTMMTKREHLVRLDLPIAEGAAEARLIGYLDGITAVVVRAEATWARGEARPTLVLTSATRRQPQPRMTRPDREWLF